MLVKCWDLNGEKRPKEDCYKAPNKKYYSCKEAYDNIVEQTGWRNRCTSFMQDVMEYDADMKLPTSWYKFLTSFAKYGYDVVYDTLVDNEKTFKWALATKEFKNDTHAISYFNAIIQNDIMAHYRKKKAQEKQEQQKEVETQRLEALPEPSYLATVGRKSVKGNDVSGLFDFV